MIISLNRRFVFVHIHKCAGTSVEMALAKALRHNDLVIGSTRSGERHQEFFRHRLGLNKHSTAAEARRWLGEDLWGQCFKFAFVRHPVDRLRSLYRYGRRLATADTMSPPEHLAFQRDGTLPDRAPYRYKAVRSALQSPTFDDFALHPLTWEDAGAQPQWRSVCDGAGTLIVDELGKVETIGADWARILGRLAIEAVLDVRNASGEGGDGGGGPLSPAACPQVCERCATDFKLFDYRPPGEPTLHPVSVS